MKSPWRARAGATKKQAVWIFDAPSVMPSAAFEKAAEISRNSKVSVSLSDKLKGYGYYKLVTTEGKGAHAMPRRLNA